MTGQGQGHTQVVNDPDGPDGVPAPAMPGTALATGQHETAITASAAQAQAAVQARFAMAAMRPRDWDTVRTRMLAASRRPRFAAVARYRLPRGEGAVEGPSIRFAEEAIRNMGNIDQQTHVIFDSPERRIVRVEATDLETNATYSKEITVEKTVERRKLKRGQRPLGTRVNSYGDTVYLVEATESDLQAKQDALISKALRTLSLRLLPGDILDECMQVCVLTLRNEDAKDPEAARKRIADSFAAIGVEPKDLKAYLGHDLAGCSPAELQHLRDLYTTIGEGAMSWAEVMQAKAEESGEGKAEGGKTASLKDRAKAEAEKARAKREAEKKAAEEKKAEGDTPPDKPAEAKGEPEQQTLGNGELSPEEEARMAAEQAAKKGKAGK